MSARLPRLWVKWTAALAALALLCAVAYFVHGLIRSKLDAEAQRDTVDVPRRAGNGIVKLGEELARSHGIGDEPAQEFSWSPCIVVYGRVVPNPQATVEVRSPFAGTLRADQGSPWPTTGRLARAGQILGYVDIRVGPQERLDLQTKLNDARLKQEGAEETLRIQQERVSRFQKLSGSEALSRRELDDALLALTEARTQLGTAKAAVGLLQKALDLIDRDNDRPNSTWSVPLTVPAAGEVTELTARPGMVVEAGGLVARVVNFRQPLVRLDIPSQALAPGPPPELELTASTAPTTAFGGQGPPARQVPALGTLVGPAPHVDVASQYVAYWYEVLLDDQAVAGPKTKEAALPSAAWRPGLFVQASLKLQGKPQEAVSVPRSALLVHQGRPLVYVRIAAGKYERREVQVLGQEESRWVLAAGVTAGEPVVWRQAQVLLSEEFRGAVDND